MCMNLFPMVNTIRMIHMAEWSTTKLWGNNFINVSCNNDYTMVATEQVLCPHCACQTQALNNPSSWRCQGLHGQLCFNQATLQTKNETSCLLQHKCPMPRLHLELGRDMTIDRGRGVLQVQAKQLTTPPPLYGWWEVVVTQYRMSTSNRSSSPQVLNPMVVIVKLLCAWESILNMHPLWKLLIHQYHSYYVVVKY
jgi:hypothetical protein